MRDTESMILSVCALVSAVLVHCGWGSPHSGAGDVAREPFTVVKSVNYYTLTGDEAMTETVTRAVRSDGSTAERTLRQSRGI